MNSRPNALQDVQALSPAQKAGLKKNNFKDFSDVVLTPPGEVSKRLRISLSEAQSIVEKVCKENSRTSLRVDGIEKSGDDKFTTGDAALDRAIGGGIRTGMVWELSGESASGKTQLALQLSLLVQVRPMLGGLSGSACYLTTHAKLSTKRLNQLITYHPLLSSSVCSLSDIHTVAVPTIELLSYTLRVTFPTLQDDLRKDATRKPIRLIVIDSISALFHTAEKSSSSTLFERSKALSELSRIMHAIANRDGIAFVVINEVTDVFNDFYSDSQESTCKGDVIYRDQARWFSSAHSIPRENAKEAGLGLVWANQLNARVMLTRTNRRRYPDDPLPLAKRRRVDEGSTGSIAFPGPPEEGDDYDQAILLRRFSVVFSSVSVPSSVDFVVTKAGISAVSDEIASAPLTSNALNDPGRASTSAMLGHVSSPQPPKAAAAVSSEDTERPPSQRFVNARVAAATDADSSSKSSADAHIEVIPSTFPEEVDELEDGGLYWEEFDDLPYDALPDIDFDGLEKSNVEEDIQASQVVASAVGEG